MVSQSYQTTFYSSGLDFYSGMDNFVFCYISSIYFIFWRCEFIYINNGIKVLANENFPIQTPDKTVYIAGILTSILPIRFNCVPEIVVIEFD